MKSTLLLIATLTIGLSLVSCFPKDAGSLETKNTSSLMSAPEEGTSPIRAQLTRYRGQTSFLTPQESYSRGRMEMASAPSAVMAKTGAGPRAEQESDVFKVGKPGTKLLYLLNNYRGLQVVSYQDGVEKPKLMSRVEATGNYPNDMYLDPSHDRLFVLERVWFDTTNLTYNQNQSRLLIYNVSKPESPQLTEKLDIKGEIADSRMVGNVLYVVTTLRPDYTNFRYNSTESQSQGFVTSYDLSGKQVNKIQEMTLSLPAVYGTNLRVVTVPEGDSYKYYLIAHLSEHGWGWWDRQSMVQVVDISDDKGKISPIMTVSVKGTIQRPHQMQIKNNTLITVSNYISNPNADRRIARVAVETFTFPTSLSEIVSENEAELRRLYIDKQVKAESAKGGDEEASRSKWVSDKTWGIQGRFVNSKNQTRKLMADSVVTTGDTTGLSASLQDVRVDGNWLYAFWVPANQVDPLDLFDISAPEKGIKFIKRLTFDGWISRAEPITFNGRKYVIGLGWIVPAVNNENNKRFAQVKLFEIVAAGKSVEAKEVSSLVLNNSQFWANFSGEDKKIEFRITEDGSGEILFEGSRYGKNSNGMTNYQDGGQIISFNLAEKDTDAIFKEGSFLAGDSTWIRRIFTNSEINRINSFSDASLVTFGANSNSPSATVEAVHILELARNIRAYVNIGDQALQVISEGNSWSMNRSEKTILRRISRGNVDAERSAAIGENSLPGGYVSHLTSDDGQSVMVLTSTTEVTENNYIQKYQLHQLKVNSNKSVQLVSSEPWTLENNPSSMNIQASVKMIAPRPYSSVTPSFLKLATGEVLISAGSELKVVNTGAASITIQSVSVENCGLNKGVQSELKDLNGQLFLFKKTGVELKEEYKTYNKAYKHELHALTWKERKLTCSEGINVPGNIVAYNGQVMLVSDSWVQDVFSASKDQDTMTMAYGLTALKVVKTEKGSHAVLVDMIDAVNSSELTHVPTPAGFSKNLSVLKFDGGAFENGYRSKNGSSEIVTVDNDGFLTKVVHTLNDAISYGSLSKILVDAKDPSKFYGVIKSWRQIQVVEFNAKARPKIAPIAAVDLQNNKLKAQNSALLLEGYSSSNEGIHYSPEQKSLEISSGLYGVKQFFIE